MVKISNHKLLVEWYYLKINCSKLGAQILVWNYWVSFSWKPNSIASTALTNSWRRQQVSPFSVDLYFLKLSSESDSYRKHLQFAFLLALRPFHAFVAFSSVLTGNFSRFLEWSIFCKTQNFRSWTTNNPIRVKQSVLLNFYNKQAIVIESEQK